MRKESTSRRRFIGITAAAAGMALLPVRHSRAIAAGDQAGTAAEAKDLHVWRGVALGADAVLQIHHADGDIARELIARSVAEVRRLERQFSLYEQDSAISRLNSQGFLDQPPGDFRRLLSESRYYSELTRGAFDPTVQPLWRLYAAHFMQPGADISGPSAVSRRTAEALVGFDRLVVGDNGVRFSQPGMGLTLNGIAQGYITDRVAELLLQAGLQHALVDMGEIRALGSRPAGGAWMVGLEDPRAPERIDGTIALRDRAVSTSGGYGTAFDADGRFNHIFDPKTGLSSRRYLSVSVIAPKSTMADALSTAFSVMPLEETGALVRRLRLEAHFVLPDGSQVVQKA